MLAYWNVPLSEGAASGLPLAWLVLIGLLGALAYTGFALWRANQGYAPSLDFDRFHWALLVLALVGLGVAAYLAYAEVLAAPVLCGPVGDCNAVQSSAYARLFGVPIGVMGLVGYSLIVAAWFWGRRRASLADQMPLVIFCVALFSALFSIYLTSVEIFVLQAVCIWCLTSAVLVALILLFSTGPILQMLSAGED